MQQATLHNTKVGDKLTAFGFTCVDDDAVVTVHKDDMGLYFPCSHGKHYLDGQLTELNEYIGLLKEEPNA